MDVLADALAAMRIGPTRSARTEVHAPWGLRFPAITGATFHVVLRGSCWLLTGGSDSSDSSGSAPLRLDAGDVLFLRTGSTHALADDPATPVRAFAPGHWTTTTTIGRVEIEGPGERSLLVCGAYQLSRGRTHPLLTQLPAVLHLPSGRARATSLPTIVDLLGTELEDHRPGRDGVVAALVDAMLLLILRAWADEHAAQNPATPGWAAALTDPAVSRALTAIHDDPSHPWTVETLGAHGGLSRSAFAERFAALVGEPPMTYLTWWRMTTAGRLLHASDAPLSAIASRVGYASEFALAKAFKREFGIAPGRYRRETDIV